MNDIQTILVEADEQTRIALRLALRAQPGIEVASEATNGTTGLVLLESIDVDVAIVDARLPDMAIGDFIRQMREVQAESAIQPSKLLLLVDLDDEESGWQTVAMEADGYCSKNSSIEQIAAAIRQIHGGNAYVDSAIAC